MLPLNVALPDKVEELKAILLGLIEPTRLEAGVIKYELLQNQSRLDLPRIEQSNRKQQKLVRM